MNKPKTSRIHAVDFSRGIALIAMAIFHFGWDLENFGLARAGMTLEPQWKYFARAIASSFLFLVGMSAFLAHHQKFKPATFIKRIGMVAIAAATITLATYFATPDAFIFFGILHNIALSSLLILLFLRLPTLLIFLSALIVLSAPLWAKTQTLDAPIWWWSGLSQFTPKANDFVPIFPWFGWVLMGLAFAKTLDKRDLWQTLSKLEFNFFPANWLKFLGRHSLIFYLVHQPIMIGTLYVFVKFIAGT